MATLKDIARETNLSIKSVSLILNGGGRAAPATRARVLKAARRMDYAPNQAARTLVSHKSRLLGAVFPYATVSFFAYILSGLEHAAARLDYSLLLVDANTAPDGNSHGWLALKRHKVDGLAMVPTPASAACFRAFMARHPPPLVQIMNVDASLGNHYVRVDNAGGVRLALEHLRDLGHSRIGLLSHDAVYGVTRERSGAFNAFLAEHALPNPPDAREDMPIAFDAGEAAAARMLARRPELTALFCCSDEAALGAMRAVLRAGLRVPEDVSVVGFDDMPESTRQASHPLTTVAQPKQEVGVLAGEMLLAMVAGGAGRAEWLPAKLIVRATTGPARSGP